MLAKIQIGKFRYPIQIDNASHNRLKLSFRYNPDVIAEIKSMGGARWSPEERVWYIANSPRNQFQLAYMMGQNPYAWYDRPLIDCEITPRQCYQCYGLGIRQFDGSICPRCQGKKIIAPYRHQVDMVRHTLTYKRVILAADMGTGKTLSAIIAMELSGETEWLWVGPRSALAGVKIEFGKWRSKIKPEFVTYEGLKKIVESGSFRRNVVFDEASRAKNPTAQRTQAAMAVADHVREHDGFIIEMSGTPAPKSPVDWWSLAEIACPGFLREGDLNKFKSRLALIQYKESLAGGVYPELVTWLDDERKCKHCGQLKDTLIHSTYECTWEASKNEVLYLYERMKGLVIVKSKRDCLDLPEKQYRIINIQPTQEVLNAAEIIKTQSSRAITALTLLRELSDGFQYREIEGGRKECDLCKGTGEVNASIAPDIDYEIDIEECPHCAADIDGFSNYCYNCGEMIATIQIKENVNNGVVDCPKCNGEGQVPKFTRHPVQVASPKTAALEDLLDEYEDVGRIVIYAGFTGSIDRCVETCRKAGWETIRVDGRGWDCSVGALSDVEQLRLFQEKLEEYSKVAYVAHPKSGGMGVTLTASPVVVNYSNTFEAESRYQSEDRIHRIGMDENRGATIIDLIHLPSDQLVLDNLKKKEKLQNMSLGRFRAQIKEIQESFSKRVT